MKAQRYILGALFCVGFGMTEVKDVSAQSKGASPNLRITVIGCIQPSRAALADSVDTTVIPHGETKYVLSNVTLVPPDDATPTADAGSTATLLTEVVTMYRLDDSAASLITPHVGDRVQVTGLIVPTSPSPRGTAGRTESAIVDARRAAMLRVESLQKISSDSAVCAR